MDSLGRISVLPAREQVAAILRQAILLRKFKEGQDLTLKDAAELVGSSITPVREAFQILENEGLIELRPNKGAVVLGVSKNSIHDHYEARMVLESYTARLASCPDCDVSALTESYKLSEMAIAREDITLYRDCNMTFHMCIWEAAGNKRIEKILSSLWNGFSLGYMISEDEYITRSWNEHKMIYEAIINHDNAQAEKYMAEHIQRSMNDILTRYDKETF